MQKYKAIISDIDGTIAPLHLTSAPSGAVKEAIQKLAMKNIPFCLATGKPFRMIGHLIGELHITYPLIVDNGAAIFDPVSKEPLWQSTLDRKQVATLFTIARQYKTTIRISNGRSGKEITAIPDENSVTKFLVMNLRPYEVDEFIKKVEGIYKDVACVRAESYKGREFLDVYVTNLDATKQHAVLRLSQLLSLPPEAMIGVGDHYNDFPLLMACGFKVAMGNAVDELKAIADYVAPSVDEDGIVTVIEKYLL